MSGLSQDDIDALAAGNDAMDRVEKRMAQGTTRYREVMPGEMRPFINAALAWRRAALNLWGDKLQADKSSMGLGPVPENTPSQKQTHNAPPTRKGLSHEIPSNSRFSGSFGVSCDCTAMHSRIERDPRADRAIS